MMDALMGIDVGTSSCKLTVFRKDGTVILTDTRKYPVYYPQDGWVERTRRNGGSASARQSQK